MAYRVTWSPEAVEDLESIAEYIGRDSLFYAQSVVTKILAVSKKIGEFPLIGRVVPEIGDENIRDRFVYSYVDERVLGTNPWFKKPQSSRKAHPGGIAPSEARRIAHLPR